MRIFVRGLKKIKTHKLGSTSMLQECSRVRYLLNKVLTSSSCQPRKCLPSLLGNTVLGRYNTPAITTLLGDGAFNGDIVAPWDVLLSNPHSRLAAGLRLSWDHLNPLSQNLCPSDQQTDETLLINQPIVR